VKEVFPYGSVFRALLKNFISNLLVIIFILISISIFIFTPIITGPQSTALRSFGLSGILSIVLSPIGRYVEFFRNQTLAPATHFASTPSILSQSVHSNAARLGTQQGNTTRHTSTVQERKYKRADTTVTPIAKCSGGSPSSFVALSSQVSRRSSEKISTGRKLEGQYQWAS